MLENQLPSRNPSQNPGLPARSIAQLPGAGGFLHVQPPCPAAAPPRRQAGRAEYLPPQTACDHPSATLWKKMVRYSRTRRIGVRSSPYMTKSNQAFSGVIRRNLNRELHRSPGRG